MFFNYIFNNTFIGNGLPAEDNSSNNFWDNGAIGNSWDNYVGVDLNDDGIGDSPYSITGTAGSQDRYPIYSDGDDIGPQIIINSSENNYIWTATQEGLRPMKGQIEKRFCSEINQTNSEICITWVDYNETEVKEIITDIVYSRLEGEAEDGIKNKTSVDWGKGNLTINEKK